jgi:hypothetical protein
MCARYLRSGTREIRRYTIGIPAYVICRRTVRGWTFSERAEEALERSHILELTADIVALANDLASLEKDSWASRDDYMNVLGGIIDGNVAALIHMVPQRYPGSLPYLRQLRSLSSP